MKNRETIQIETLAIGGAGVGKIVDSQNPKNIGKIGFVPFSIPGELLAISIEEEKPRYFTGRVDSVLKSSIDRITPECRYFTVCGGCDLQHINFKKQLILKKNLII